MGASTSSALPKLPSLREEQSDAGEESAGESEPVISRRSLKSLEAQAMSRINELEGELSAERQRAKLKEEELEKTQRLLAKLEGVLDQQAKDSQLEQDRLSTLEEALASQRTGTEEKVAKLLLAVAGEKHRAELAEKAREEAAGQAAAEFEARLDAEETLRRKAEEESEACKKQVATLLSAREAPVLGDAPQGTEELQQQLIAEQSVRREAEDRAAEKEAQLEALRQQLAERHAKVDDEEPSEMTSEMVRDLQQQLATEISKRMDVQQRLLGKDRRLREVQRQLGGEGGGAEESASLREVQRRLSEEECKRQRAEVLCMEKESQLQDLQEQLADELKKRMAAQSQVADKERRLRELQKAIEEDGVTRQQVVQGQVIEKEREVCELQQQLADELSKRQAVQYQIIEKERLICHLQQQLLRTRAAAPPQRRMLGPSIAEEFLTDGAIEEEPDDEKPPRSDMRESPLTTSRWTVGSSVASPIGTSSSTDSSYNHSPATAAPPVPTAGRATWGPTSMQQVQANSGLPSALASPQTGPRNPHSSSTGAEVNYFIRNCTAPPSTGSSVDVPAASSGTGLIRNRMYLARGAAVSGGATVYSSGSTDTWTTSMPQTWEVGGVDVSKTIAYEVQDKHQRRLLLAARTFT